MSHGCGPDAEGARGLRVSSTAQIGQGKEEPPQFAAGAPNAQLALICTKVVVITPEASECETAPQYSVPAVRPVHE